MEVTITVCLPKDLSEADLAACLQVLKEGDAVDLEYDSAELPHALRVAVVRAESVVIGVAAIKRPRPKYAASIAGKSAFTFASDMPELGYAAVREADQGHNLGGRLVQEILASYGKKPLFATTAHPAMKKHLARAGFGSYGKPWRGKDGGELTYGCSSRTCARRAASTRSGCEARPGDRRTMSEVAGPLPLISGLGRFVETGECDFR